MSEKPVFRPSWCIVREMRSTTYYSGDGAEAKARAAVGDAFPDQKLAETDWTTTLEKWDEASQEWVRAEP